MSYCPEDFEPAADALLAHWTRFQQQGAITREDVLVMMADLFNCAEEIEERRAERLQAEEEEATTANRTGSVVTIPITSHGSTWQP